ncbi:MAG: endonuclease/exonuclease/phosphatase family protein [Cyclonatronaceae bacterium]
MKKTVLLLLAAFAMLLLSVTACREEPDPTVIRIMSYNIAAGQGDISAIAGVIREHDPDIVALQEVDLHWGIRSGYEDQAKYLAEALGMDYFYGEIYTLPPDREGAGVPDRQYGLAFLSKEPIRYAQNHQLTRHSTQPDASGIRELPGFPVIAIPYPGGIVHFYNTHLDYRADPAIRQAQVMEMIEIIEQVDAPVVLAGDLNARPDASELDPLFAMLRDAWEGQDDQDDPGYTFPADNPDRRIDYIMHSPHFEVATVEVVDSQASDHLSIVADLVLRPDPPENESDLP